MSFISVLALSLEGSLQVVYFIFWMFLLIIVLLLNFSPLYIPRVLFDFETSWGYILERASIDS